MSPRPRAAPRAREWLDRRRAGVLAHPTSLPGPGTNGTLGAHARRFLDFMDDCGISVWQVLPLGPTHGDLSPYQTQSIHAGSARLIDTDTLVEWGWFEPGELSAAPAYRILDTAAAARFVARMDSKIERRFGEFREQNAFWLDDFALYSALKAAHEGLPWWRWPTELRDRETRSMEAAAREHAGEIRRCHVEQFAFAQQWRALKADAERRDILLFGDMPIFVAADSADVWVHRDQFRLDSAGAPEVVTGVPPDAFSDTGQRWGSPHYDWQAMHANSYAWWRERLRAELDRCHLVRIDHFRGFVSAWEIPASCDTAVEGRWAAGPGAVLFDALLDAFGSLPLVAEDLGMITEDVHALRRRFCIPGMKVLQFAFEGGPENPYLPHNHCSDCVVYPATHDNDTTAGWYAGLPGATRERVRAYLGAADAAVPPALVRAALASVAKLCVITMQDLLGLGAGHRMNTPGVAQGNWRWRFAWSQVPSDLGNRLTDLIHLYGR